MSLVVTLAKFSEGASQCGRLIANAHQVNSAGESVLPALDQRQITVAAFLNLFVSWETFLEEALTKLMAGATTISGRAPVRYVLPKNIEAAQTLIIGTLRYFDYGSHDNVRKIVNMYFEGGYPFEPHLGAISNDLCDLRTMRNSSAHLSSTTRVALESLAQRIFTTPRPGINLYSLLTTVDPRSTQGNTVFAEAREKLLIVAGLVANG